MENQREIAGLSPRETEQEQPKTEVLVVDKRAAAMADPEPPRSEDDGALAKWAISRGATIDELREMISLEREMRADKAKRAYHSAMAELRKHLPTGIPKLGHNPQTGKNHVRHSDQVAACAAVIGEHGFNYDYKPDQTRKDGWLFIVMRVIHRDGHVEEFTLGAKEDGVGTGGKPNKIHVQAVGSTNSYLRRYLFDDAFGTTGTDDDDDGESSNGGRGRLSEDPSPRRDPVRRSERPATGSEKRTRQDAAIGHFAPLGLSATDLAGYFGKPAAEWGEAEFRAMGPLHREAKQAKADLDEAAFGEWVMKKIEGGPA